MVRTGVRVGEGVNLLEREGPMVRGGVRVELGRCEFAREEGARVNDLSCVKCKSEAEKKIVG